VNFVLLRGKNEKFWPITFSTVYSASTSGACSRLLATAQRRFGSLTINWDYETGGI
jgi:hypothetical protein